MASEYAAMARGKSRALKNSLPSLAPRHTHAHHNLDSRQGRDRPRGRSRTLTHTQCTCGTGERGQGGSDTHFFLRVARSDIVSAKLLTSREFCLCRRHCLASPPTSRPTVAVCPQPSWQKWVCTCAEAAATLEQRAQELGRLITGLSSRWQSCCAALPGVTAWGAELSTTVRSTTAVSGTQRSDSTS